MRKPSLMQACRKGNFLASASVMGEEILPSAMALSTSARSRLHMTGLVKTCNVIERKAMAVVSDPPMLYSTS